MRKFSRGLGWTLGVILVIALFLRLVILDVWTLPDDPYIGASVAPTLAAGDTVILSRRGQPHFGDLVRCVDPTDPTAFVIGRIGGVEGDTVEIEGRRLRVDGVEYKGESACSEPKVFVKHPETLKDVQLSCEIVTMGGGWHYRVSSISPFQEQKKSITVGPGKFFLVSDNRTMHDDSRDFGLVDRDTCKERVLFRLWGKDGWSDDKSRFTVIH